MRKIDQPPAYDAIQIRCGTCFDGPQKRGALHTGEQRRLARRPAIKQAVRPFGVQSRTICRPTPPIFAAMTRGRRRKSPQAPTAAAFEPRRGSPAQVGADDPLKFAAGGIRKMSLIQQALVHSAHSPHAMG
jgi:hypothetical protein